MPQQAATGLMGIPIMALARLVASSDTFRGVVGAGSTAEAIDRSIYWLWADDEEDAGRSPESPGLIASRPRALIDWPDEWGTQRLGPGTWDDSGSLMLSFEFIPPAEYKDLPKEESIWFLNKVGAIIDEMRTNSGQADADLNPYLNATNFTVVVNPAPSVRSEEVEYFWGVAFKVSWPR